MKPFGKVTKSTVCEINLELNCKELFMPEDEQVNELNKLLSEGYQIKSFHKYSHDKDRGVIHCIMQLSTRIDS